MKYGVLLLAAGLVFGLCFLTDKGTGLLLRWAENRRRVKPPLRYPVLAAVLAAAAAGLAVYSMKTEAALYLAAAAAFFCVAVYAVVYYRTTEITYDEETFVFRRGRQRITFRFDRIQGQRADVTRKTKCLVLCLGENEVVIYSNMQGYRPFLTQGYRSWCKAKGLDPDEQSWHDPEDTQWFPDMPDDKEA